jgi:hypothetical protein
MSAMLSPAQSELPGVSLPVEMSTDETTVRPTGLKNDWSPSERPSRGKQALLVFARFSVTFCIGVAAALAWQLYGEEVREKIAISFPQLDWLAPRTAPVAQTAAEVTAQPEPAGPSPDQQQLNASFDLEAVRQSVDLSAADTQVDVSVLSELAAAAERALALG